MTTVDDREKAFGNRFASRPMADRRVRRQRDLQQAGALKIWTE